MAGRSGSLGNPAILPGDAEWYIDGSCFDINMPDMRSTGFGAVAVGAQGEVLALVHGQPPEFVRNAPGAEAWALYVVLSSVVHPPTITTDCFGLINYAVLMTRLLHESLWQGRGHS